MTDETDAPALASEEAGEAMHIHRPKPLHGWRDILLEIGVIVVGIVIAVGLEQSTEFLHHRHQLEQLEAAIQKDGRANRAYVESDIANAQIVLDWALDQAAAVERAGPTGSLTLRRMPAAEIGAPDAGVWPSARASGVSNLLPSAAQNWLEYLAELYNETFATSSSSNGRLVQAYAALDQALLGHARETPSGDLDVSSLDVEQRAVLAERLRAIAENARRVMQDLLVYDASSDLILSTPLDQLDTPEAEKRYDQIYAVKLAAHPAAKFTFGGR
jgi:hypothetical protein